MKIRINGQMFRKFDNKGKLLEAFTYDSCLATRAPDGTAIVNIACYSVTTDKHRELVWESLGTEHVLRVNAPLNSEPCDLVDLVQDEVT